MLFTFLTVVELLMWMGVGGCGWLFAAVAMKWSTVQSTLMVPLNIKKALIVV